MADLHTAIVELLQLKASRDLTCFRFAHREQRSAIAAARLKRRMGVVAGIPDLVFVLSDPARAAFLQVKRTGRLSPEQIAFRDRCTAVGVPYAIARSGWRRRSAFSRPGAGWHDREHHATLRFECT